MRNEAALDGILNESITKHVKWSKPIPKKPAPCNWWNQSCQEAYAIKCKLFLGRLENRSRYNAAVGHCRTVQNRALAKYQYKLRVQIAGMRKNDKRFWKLAKEFGGIESSRSTATPNVDKLVDHFADKMSSGN